MRTAMSILLFALFATVPMFANSPVISENSPTSGSTMEETGEAALVDAPKDNEAIYADLMEKLKAQLGAPHSSNNGTLQRVFTKKR